jgi:hypothetical protein
MNFMIELKLIKAGICSGLRYERIVAANTKDEAYDKFFANSTIRAAMNKTDDFMVSLRKVGIIE